MIISRAGKESGKYKYKLDIKNIDTDSLSNIDFSSVKNWKYLEEEVLIYNVPEFSNNIGIFDSKMNELQNGNDHEVYRELEDEGQNVVSVTKKQKSLLLTFL